MKKGVAQVSRVGGVDREINVIVDPDRLAAQGLTATALNTALSAFDVDYPGGRMTIGGREQTVRVLGSTNTVERLRNLTIPTGGARASCEAVRRRRRSATAPPKGAGLRRA